MNVPKVLSSRWKRFRLLPSWETPGADRTQVGTACAPAQSHARVVPTKGEGSALSRRARGLAGCEHLGPERRRGGSERLLLCDLCAARPIDLAQASAAGGRAAHFGELRRGRGCCTELAPVTGSLRQSGGAEPEGLIPAAAARPRSRCPAGREPRALAQYAVVQPRVEVAARSGD